MVIICSDLWQNSAQEPFPASVLALTSYLRCINLISMCGFSLFRGAIIPGCLLGEVKQEMAVQSQQKMKQ